MPAFHTVVGQAQLTRLKHTGKNLCRNCRIPFKLGDDAVIKRQTKRKWYCKSCAEKLKVI